MTLDEILQPDGSVWIAEQIFPARVVDYRTPHLPLDEVKTCLLEVRSGEYALMIIHGTNNGPEVRSIDAVTLKDTTSRTHIVTVIGSGDEIHYSESAGCGCGSRVRGWTPFTGRLLGVPFPRV